MINDFNEYPPHIKYLLEDLTESDEVIPVLKKYTSTLSSDSVLSEIFYNLGYLESCDSFTRVPSKFEAIRSLQNYYAMTDADYYDYSSDSWDVQRGIKEEFLKVFYDNKLQDLSEAIDLGLHPFENEENSLQSLWTTPQEKKNCDSISTDENTPNKNSRGLKLLTNKVKHIIFSKGFFSYKQVSDELVKELEITEGLDRNKEEKNVLRRVYDALNVLIASEVVVKKGKKYVWKQTVTDRNSVLKKKINKQKIKMNAKKEVLKDVVKNFLLLTQLLNRNKKKPESQFIQFPFIIVATEENPENAVKMESNLAHNEISIKFRKDIKLFGDMEILHRLELKKDLKVLPNDLQVLLRDTL